MSWHALLQGNLPNPGIKSGSPALQANSLPSEPYREALLANTDIQNREMRPQIGQLQLRIMQIQKPKKVLTDWNLQTVKLWGVCPALSHPFLRNGIHRGKVPSCHICMTPGKRIRVKPWNKWGFLSWKSDWLMKISNLEFGAHIYSQTSPPKNFPLTKSWACLQNHSLHFFGSFSVLHHSEVDRIGVCILAFHISTFTSGFSQQQILVEKRSSV